MKHSEKPLPSSRARSLRRVERSLLDQKSKKKGSLHIGRDDGIKAIELSDSMFRSYSESSMKKNTYISNAKNHIFQYGMKFLLCFSFFIFLVISRPLFAANNPGFLGEAAEQQQNAQNIMTGDAPPPTEELGGGSSQLMPFPDPFGGASIPVIVSRIVQAGLSFAGALFFVMFLWGGSRYLTAGGDPKHVESAKKILINAVIGLVIVALSYVIVAQIFGIIIAGGSGGQTVQ